MRFFANEKKVKSCKLHLHPPQLRKAHIENIAMMMIIIIIIIIIILIIIIITIMI